MKLIGHAGHLAATLRSELDTTRPVKLLFHGEPGIGKTKLAEAVAESLGNKWDVEAVNGRNVTIDLVREWQHSLHSSMFGSWKVKIINEADLMTAPAQDLMLSVLDEMPAQRAIICTSNLSLKDFQTRFHTRFIKKKVEPPTQEEIANLLCEHGLPADQAAFIAVACGGNVRAALNDAEAWAMEHKHAARAYQQDLSAVLLGL